MHCCSVCAYTAHVITRLKLHMKRMRPDVFEKEFGNDTRMFYCSACEYKNRLKDRLKPHVEKNHPEIFSQEFPVDQSKMKQCSACPYKNQLKCKVRVHVKRCHPEIYEKETGMHRASSTTVTLALIKIETEFCLNCTLRKNIQHCSRRSINRMRPKCRSVPNAPSRIWIDLDSWCISKRGIRSCMSENSRKRIDYFHKCRVKEHVKRKHPELLPEGEFKFDSY